MPKIPESLRRPTNQLTPVQLVDGIYLKRDDLWQEGTLARGAKARTIGLICREVIARGKSGVTVAVDRNSSVPGVLSRLCKFYNLACHLHIPASVAELPNTLKEAVSNGTILHAHRPGYMSVRRARLREQLAADHSLVEIELGMKLGEIGVRETALQAGNIPPEVKRVIMPVGSGRMILGVYQGLQLLQNPPKLVAVCVGAVPDVCKAMIGIEIISSELDFHKALNKQRVGSVDLDPIYEAKCLRYVKPGEGDLLWIVAHRETE